MFNKDEKKIISERLKTLRKRKGFTQEKVAEKLLFSREYFGVRHHEQIVKTFCNLFIIC